MRRYDPKASQAKYNSISRETEVGLLPGETVQEFLARGGKVQKVRPSRLGRPYKPRGKGLR